MLEENYVNTTSIIHRKEFAQFFTPSIVAQLMAEWILQSKPKKVLDPAFGLGVFYREVRQLSENTKVVGFEIDNYILSNIESSTLADPLLEIHNQDYLDSDPQEFDAIICNPPYLRFQKFKNRFDILPKLQEQIGADILGYANIASVFLVKSLHQLKLGGRLAYIMPYEFLNAGYGKKIKQILLEENYLKSIIIFENEKEIFPEAITTVCVLLCEKNAKSSDISISFVSSREQLESINSFEELESVLVKKDNLNHSKKWSPIFDSLHTNFSIPEGFCEISTYGNFKRGIATGANEFFALSPSKVKQLQLPEQSLKLCITKSAQIKNEIFDTASLNELILRDANIYCLDAKEPLDANTKSYIQYGEEIEVNQRYLTKIRTPWYKIEERTPSPLLFGVFSRNKYKVIRNFTNCINFTCYHSFYPNLIGFNVVDKLFLYLLSDLGNSVLQANQRKYGAGLMKFEPNDLNSSFAPSLKLFDKISDEDVTQALNEIKKNPSSGTQIANLLMAKLEIK